MWSKTHFGTLLFCQKIWVLASYDSLAGLAAREIRRYCWEQRAAFPGELDNHSYSLERGFDLCLHELIAKAGKWYFLKMDCVID